MQVLVSVTPSLVRRCVCGALLSGDCILHDFLVRSITETLFASNSCLYRRYRALSDTRVLSTIAVVVVAMATAIAWPGGALSCMRSSSLPMTKVYSLSSAAVVKQSHFLRVARIASGCGFVFRDVRCEATMVGKEAQLVKGQEMNKSDLLVIGPGVLGSIVGRRWLEVGYAS